MEVKKYDQSEVYKHSVLPIIKELERVCYQNGIPVFTACAVTETGKETFYQHSLMGPTNLNMQLSDDKLAEFIRVIQGYRVIAPDDFAEIQFDTTK